MQNIIKRDEYLNRIIDRKENGLIKVITGIRRCGKSFLLFNLFYDYLIESGVKEEQIITIALDDDTFVKYRDPDELSKYIRGKIVNSDMYYILIDEVQYAITKDELKKPENIKLYNVLNGLMRLRNVDIYVTGSNSKMLTKDVLTAFRGRGDEVRVYPISFKEYYSFVGGDKSDAYEEYALYGGMPLVLTKKSDAEKMNYLHTLFTEVYFKDIVERYDIELPDVLSELTDDLCSSVGSLTNASKISNTLQTVKNIKVSGRTGRICAFPSSMRSPTQSAYPALCRSWTLPHSRCSPSMWQTTRPSAALPPAKRPSKREVSAHAPPTVPMRKLSSSSLRTKLASSILAVWWKQSWTATALAASIPSAMCTSATAWHESSCAHIFDL